MRFLVIVAMLLFIFPAYAQDEETETRSRFTRFVENQLSTDNRQIRLNGIEGALSSEAVIRQITIADREGVWLRINNAEIVWTRSALLLGRLEIDRLAADSIEVLRQPLPSEEAAPPAPEASGFSLPELPVSVRLETLEVPEVVFGPTVFGQEARLSVNGGFRLADGALETALQVERLDGPGGTLALDLAYSNETGILDLDLLLSEPEDGIVANLLNIEGRPAVELALAGSGPLGDLQVDLTLDADGQRVLTGSTVLQRVAEGLAIDADVEGPIARLIAPVFRDFFGANSNLSLRAVVRDGGGLNVESLTIDSGAVALRASAQTGEDNFLRRLQLQATMEDPAGEPVVLPVAGGATTLRSAALTIDYGAEASEQWGGALTVEELSTETLDAETVELDFGGLAQALDQPDARRVTFQIDGGIVGISTPDPAVQTALGEEIALNVAGEWSSGEPVDLQTARIEAEALVLALAGAIEEFVFDGTISIEAASIAPFADLSGRPLAGSLDLEAQGSIAPLSGGFDLVLEGMGAGLRVGTPALDALLESTVALSGRLARTEDGFQAGDFRIANEQFMLAVDGVYSSERADLALNVALADLALVSERASGRLTITGTARGQGGPVNFDVVGEIPSGELAGRRLRDARFAFAGNLVGADADTGETYGEGIEGTLDGEAFLDGEAVRLAAEVRATEEARSVSGLQFSAGGATLTGNVVQNPEGLLDGNLAIDAPNIETLAALALRDATGSADARIRLAHQEGEQNAAVEATLDDVVVDDIEIGRADIQLEIADLFGVPKVEGALDGSSIEAAGVTVETLSANARREDATTQFDASATLDRGTEIALAGALEETEAGLAVELETLELVQGATTARLLEPVAVTVEGERIAIGDLRLEVDGGTVRASGVVADTLDLDLEIADLPLSIANTVVPDLQAAGTIDGSAQITGARNDPRISFSVAGADITAAPIRQAGLPPIDIEAEGSTDASRLIVDAALRADGGIAVAVDGSIPLDDGNVDLTVSADDFPLQAVDALAGNRGLGGTLTATADVSGSLASPQVAFEIDGRGLSADQLRGLGIEPLSVSANGRFADGSVSLTSATATNGQGLNVSASGTVPVTGSGLGVDIRGSAPLALANAALGDRGTRLSGDVEFNVAVSGSLRDPQFNGTVATGNAGVIDPGANVQLENITLRASLEGQQVNINTLSAALSSGGTITGGGTISLDQAASFPADLTINLNEARYADGDFLIVTASGTLRLTGTLARDPLLSGTINVDRAEIGIPEGGAGTGLTDVTHVAAPPDVRRTLQRAGQSVRGETPTPTARPSILQLAVTVNAPRRIFVRGRGLDAELGGSIRIEGPVTSIEPVGSFELIRGRLSILGRRIVFDDGSVTLIGDLDPFVNLTATSQSGDTTVIITVSGRASDISIDFSSQPALPQDEVIARLIFDRSISELSAFQIAQLAAAVAELSGGQNTSLLGQLRQSTGLDDLDVVTDAEGNAAVRAGRYVRDNVYLGVQAGSGGSSEVTIDLDITENLKARGAAGADGESSIGLFYERDY